MTRTHLENEEEASGVEVWMQCRKGDQGSAWKGSEITLGKTRCLIEQFRAFSVG